MIRITQTEPFEPIYVNVSTVNPDRPAMEEGDGAEPGQSVLEAALLAAREPMTPNDMKRCSTMSCRPIPAQAARSLREEWAERPVELIQLASGWRFRPGRVPAIILSA